MIEKNYDFRKFLDEVHAKSLRDHDRKPAENQVCIDESWSILLPENASSFIVNTARDLADYLFVSMDVSVRIATKALPGEKYIVFAISPSLTVKRSFKLHVEKTSILIEGADERGIAMGCYYLEDVMTLNEAPFMDEVKELVKEPLFSPRMIHSGYGMDIFTPRYLKRIAHAGFDTVLVYVMDGGRAGHHGPIDFTAMIDMAEEAGLDVYFYSAIRNIYHPSDDRADAFYEAQYGGLFKRYPKVKGLVLVGESCQFPSKDPDTTMSLTSQSEPCYRAGGKPAPGWWPCSDYPEFVSLIRDKVRKYTPDADIVFWTYNWAHAPEELRTKLIDNLPKDITVELNFEMHDNCQIWGTQERALDYTLSLTGPSNVYKGEGKAAKRNNIRLYTMCNTAGRTWDVGCAPYLPVPQQWAKRMKNLLFERENTGLSGLMETHHYGWYPSVISDMGKWLFWSNSPSLDDVLHSLAAREFSAETAETVVKVWEDWSKAVASFITPIEDQYGPCRVGPAYPFLFAGISLRQTFGMNMTFPWTPFCKYAIAFPEYKVVNDPNGLDMGIHRVNAEIKHLPELISLWKNGADKLETLLPQIPERKHKKAKKMIGLARFIANTLVTTLHIKKWWKENNLLIMEEDPEKALQILERIKTLATEELENVKATLPLVDEDSSLGYEPSMDYAAGRAQLEWKIRQLSSVLEIDIPNYEKGISVAQELEK